MDNEALICFLESRKIKFIQNYPSWKINSFEIGGIAKLAVFPSEIDDFCEILKYLYNHGIKYCIIGKGTNTFFSDNGYNGVIVSSELLNKIFVTDNVLTAWSGASITDCSIYAMKHALTGMEFCCGIPGSVGGAVYMNAAAFQKSVSDILISSTVFDLDENKKYSLNLSEHFFDKKASVFSKNKKLILLYTDFALKKSNKDFVKAKMQELVLKRIHSQPLGQGSLGSTFKRPENSYASKLIDDSDLKGYKIGGAQVSTKHAGFIVNHDNATSEDVLKLIDKIKKEVLKNFGIPLEEEIIFME